MGFKMANHVGWIRVRGILREIHIRVLCTRYICTMFPFNHLGPCLESIKIISALAQGVKICDGDCVPGYTQRGILWEL